MRAKEFLRESQNKITDHWFNTGSFKTYKKANPVKYVTARKSGTLQTLEGPVTYDIGFKIITGPKGEQYPIPPKKFVGLYDDNGDGTATPKKIMKMAKLADHDGVVNTSWGEPLNYTAGNDYIVRHGANDYGVVKKDIFTQTYVKESATNEDYRDAARYAAQAHDGQKRSGGKPYISHPVRVANLVRKYKDSKQLDKLLSAAFLHDTIEDTDTTEEQLRKMFGDLVATLVKELTSDKAKIEKLGKAEYLTQKMIHMSSWGLVIKLADRLDNVADIKTAKTPEWRRRYRTETENILTQLEQNRKLSGTHQNLIAAIRGKLSEIDESYVNEADAAQVGRKYQHIEDLVFTNGSIGGLHAVERLRHMGEEGANIELKWDGMPVVYWGRDENGTFTMVPKNAWEYAKRGKTELDQGIKVKANSAQDVYNFVANTGKNLESPERRQQFGKQIAELWPYLEKASPKQGYLEGGVLFWPSDPPKLNQKTGEWDFKPNVTEFHVAANSPLGKRISKAKVMIAATGYYPSFGSGDEGRLESVESLSTGDAIIQGTTYVQEPPKLDTKALDKVESYIKQNAAKIDAFLSAKPGLKSRRGNLYIP